MNTSADRDPHTADTADTVVDTMIILARRLTVDSAENVSPTEDVIPIKGRETSTTSSSDVNVRLVSTFEIDDNDRAMAA